MNTEDNEVPENISEAAATAAEIIGAIIRDRKNTDIYG